MKTTLFLTLAICTLFLAHTGVKAQSDPDRILMNPVVQEDGIPQEACRMLENRLTRSIASNGFADNSYAERFVLVAKVDITSKDIVPTTPPRISQKIDVTLMAGDIVENKVFSTRTFSLAGIGINETKAFISAFSRLDPEQKDLQAMLAEAKEKIVGYYTTHCDEIIRNAQALAGMQKYDEAIFRLMSVPNVCSDCYALCQQTAVSLYTGKINSESTALLNEARTIWMKQPDDIGAQKVAVLINQIAPEASNYKEVEAFRKDIADKLEADARKAWDLEMKQYQDRQEFKRSIVDACKAVGVAFGKGQPQSIVKTITSRW